MLVRVARQSDVNEGQLVQQECHGRQILLVRNHGTVFCSDAHCFHQGFALVGGDIEDVAGRTCVVCPAHRYRIDMSSGCKVDSDLCGNVCASADQKQRTYAVTGDGEFIWVDFPDLPLPRRVPSDQYNGGSPQPAQQQLRAPPVRQNFGLLGVSSSGGVPGPASEPAAPPTPLEPYAGVTNRPMVLSQGDAGSEGQLQFSQEMAMSQPSPARQSQPSPAPAQRSGQVRVDPPHVARRKAATAAILAKTYKPPTISVTASQAGPAHTAQKLPKPAQQTLLDMAWGLQRAASTAAGAGDDMDMD